MYIVKFGFSFFLGGADFGSAVPRKHVISWGQTNHRTKVSGIYGSSAHRKSGTLLAWNRISSVRRTKPLEIFSNRFYKVRITGCSHDLRVRDFIAHGTASKYLQVVSIALYMCRSYRPSPPASCLPQQSRLPLFPAYKIYFTA